MNSKKIGGIRVCDCDRRFKPVMCRTQLDNPFYYYVQCVNCGARGANVLHRSGESHSKAQQAAALLWNDRNMVVVIQEAA